MLGIEHDYVEPLYRPPLSLAIIAAAIKYITTAIVLEDPILMTRSDFIKRRQETGLDADNRTKFHLGARILFCMLALYTFIMDVLMLIHGYPHVKGWQRVHLLAMVLAFSPNTVAAVAAAFVTEAKMTWLMDLPLRSDRLGWATDAIAILYANCMSMVYTMPILFVTMMYGIAGGVTMVYCFVKDAASLPWRLHDHHMNAIWIALPIVFALMIRTAVNLGLILGQEWYVKWRYPEMSARIEAGDRVNMLKVRMPEQVSARVIGYARSVALATSPRSALRAIGGGNPNEADQDVTEQPLVDLCENGQALQPSPLNGGSNGTDVEKSILNDNVLAWMCYVKTSVCVSVPILQLCVIIAARVYLGNAMWEAGVKTFEERSWSHYMGHVRQEGHHGWLRLLWTYL